MYSEMFQEASLFMHVYSNNIWASILSQQIWWSNKDSLINQIPVNEISYAQHFIFNNITAVQS